jgi:hypothetical protein
LTPEKGGKTACFWTPKKIALFGGVFEALFETGHSFPVKTCLGRGSVWSNFSQILIKFGSNFDANFTVFWQIAKRAQNAFSEIGLPIRVKTEGGPQKQPKFDPSETDFLDHFFCIKI